MWVAVAMVVFLVLAIENLLDRNWLATFIMGAMFLLFGLAWLIELGYII